MSRSNAVTGATIADVQSWLPNRVKQLLSAGKLQVVQSVNELPPFLRQRGRVLYHAAWHGSPYDHDKFDASRIGTGEGAAAFGHGHYFTDLKEIARYYSGNLGFGGATVPVRLTINGKHTEADTPEHRVADLIHSMGLSKAKTFIKGILKEAQNSEPWTLDKGLTWYEQMNTVAQSIARQSEVKKQKGKLFRVELTPNQDEYLDWNKPMSEQSEKVKRRFKKLIKKYGSHAKSVIEDDDLGEIAYRHMSNYNRNVARVEFGEEHKVTSADLLAVGIRGIRYKADNGNSDANNYVIFSDDDIRIKAKYSRDLGGVEALYDERNDHLYLVADMLNQGNIQAVLYHELFHRAEAVDSKLKSAVSRFDSRMRERFDLASQGRGTAIEQSAYRRILAAGTPAKDQLSEFKAYLVTEYQQAPENFVGAILKIIQDFIAAIRAAMVRTGLPMKNLTPADLTALARYGVRIQMERGEINAVALQSFSRVAQARVNADNNSILSEGIIRIGNAEITLCNLPSGGLSVDRIEVPESCRNQGEVSNALLFLAEEAKRSGTVLCAQIFPDGYRDETLSDGLLRAFTKAGFKPLEMDGEIYYNDVEFNPALIVTPTDEEVVTLMQQYAGMDSAPTLDQLIEAVGQYRKVEARFFNADGSPKEDAMLAPNGNPTQLNKIQWIQVRTDNFKQWFGDWEYNPGNASKAIDKNGEPLVVFRGEHADGDEMQTRLGSLSFGSAEVASVYAIMPNDRLSDVMAKNPKIFSTYLRIVNPIMNDIHDPFIDLSIVWEKLGSNAAIRAAKENFEAIENTAEWEENFYGQYESIEEVVADNPELIKQLYVEAFRLLDAHWFIDEIKKAGFDGAIHAEYGCHTESGECAEYKVFGNEQIKSALSNTGQFDHQSCDIRFSFADQGDYVMPEESIGVPTF